MMNMYHKNKTPLTFEPTKNTAKIELRCRYCRTTIGETLPTDINKQAKFPCDYCIKTNNTKVKFNRSHYRNSRRT